MEEKTTEQESIRNPDGTFKAGVSGNAGGRPKNSMKSYVSRKLNAMTDEEKEAWLESHKIPGIDQWKMGEGNPRQDNDSTVKIELPQPLLHVLDNNSNQEDNETLQED